MDREQIAELAADMVAVPSVNPLERPLAEGCGEAALAGFVAERLAGAGIACELVEAAPGRPSVLARLPGESEEAIWFDAHLDTVSGEGMAFEPFIPRIEGDILYGRGAADCKGCLAAMMAAMMAVAESGQRPPASIILTATADEEYRMRGLTSLLDSGVRARAAVVGEPTSLEVVVAHKGVARFRIIAKGKAVHSSRPEEGVNAIYHMARAIQLLEAYARRGVGRETDPLLGKATLAVTVIRGGRHANVIPDRCEVEVDRRLLPSEEGRRAVADVRAYLTDAVPAEVELEFTPPDVLVPGLSISVEDSLVQAVLAAVREVTGSAPINGMSGTTHAGTLMAAGIPAVVFGPGAMGQAHTPTEGLDLNQLEPAARVYESLMRSGATR